ncbi:hypothetical protein EC917_12637 [Bacillus thuringiensis]|uniref:Uncharacterized protein n=1 Tax=Bacillus thuringiensis TaxID=1428 RepID=A0A4R4B1W5_BACTU|nr:hypothetical protein [Bacillus thuringiensis]TCW46886.1 hypothetical protein EC917_12637 [Bacillus thuringiensis]TCW47116.1 hypothetical protein EC910_12537 [Bacillus thuringiensis]
MKYEHAITLDKPLLSLGGIIKIYQRNEVTEPIRKRDFSICSETGYYIEDKMKALHIDYDGCYEYYDTISLPILKHDCEEDCYFAYEKNYCLEVYGYPCTLENLFQDWGLYIINEMECKLEKVMSEYVEVNNPLFNPTVEELARIVKYNKGLAKDCSELFNIPLEPLKKALKESSHTVIEIIQNIEMEDITKLPTHLGVRFAYRRETKELYIYYGEKHFPGLYRVLLFLRIFELSIPNVKKSIFVK